LCETRDTRLDEATTQARAYGTLALSVGVGLIGLVSPSSAGAATQIGETFAPGDCDGGFIYITTGSPGGSYAAPAPGVITSWSFQGGSTPTQLRLKIGRPAGGNNYTIVGEGKLESPPVGVLTSFPVRISVQAGDVLGFYLVSGKCGVFTADYPYAFLAGDAAPGTTAAFTPGGTFKWDISALLEPDADNDGFGDETQDQCPTDETAQGVCPVPDTTITKRPKDKTKKKTATFEFTSTLPGATFECSLDGAAFAACSSPDTLKVKKGKHSFAVRATAKGQTDASPASDDWKVKKKKR
jgi:hypothetical protein